MQLPVNWLKLSATGASTSSAQFFQTTNQGAIHSADGLRFLRHVMQRVGEVIVVLDNAGIHTAKQVQAYEKHHLLGTSALKPRRR